MRQFIQLGHIEFLVAFIKRVLFSGRHCCLCCEIAKEEMKIARNNRGKLTPRTLQTLTNDYEKFINLGSNIKNAKLAIMLLISLCSIFLLKGNTLMNFSHPRICREHHILKKIKEGTN